MNAQEHKWRDYHMKQSQPNITSHILSRDFPPFILNYPQPNPPHALWGLLNPMMIVMALLCSMNVIWTYYICHVVIVTGPNSVSVSLYCHSRLIFPKCSVNISCLVTFNYELHESPVLNHKKVTYLYIIVCCLTENCHS